MNAVGNKGIKFNSELKKMNSLRQLKIGKNDMKEADLKKLKTYLKPGQLQIED